jgi:hypothetical protein
VLNRQIQHFHRIVSILSVAQNPNLVDHVILQGIN